MTQRLCNHHEKEGEQGTGPTRKQYDNEASEMMARILSMSKTHRDSRQEEPTKVNCTEKEGSKDDDEDTKSDSDISYWSEDEYTVLKAFYENENQEEEEEKDEKMLEKYIMDICQKQQQQQ